MYSNIPSMYLLVQNAFKSFDQMDKLIDAVNGNPALNATVRYGTFGSYVAVRICHSVL